MKFGICGLGRMGAALALQALEKCHEVVVIAELSDRFVSGAAGTSS